MIGANCRTDPTVSAFFFARGKLKGGSEVRDV